MVRPRRFERLTYSFGGCCSIQLSYGRMVHTMGNCPVSWEAYAVLLRSF